jgi:hypothetical protein
MGRIYMPSVYIYLDGVLDDDSRYSPEEEKLYLSPSRKRGREERNKHATTHTFIHHPAWGLTPRDAHTTHNMTHT